MRFEFATATRIIFGAGTLRDVGPIAGGIGHRALVVTGRSTERANRLLADLEAEGIGVSVFSVEGEPSTDVVRKGSDQARNSECELVIGFGGGSALEEYTRCPVKAKIHHYSPHHRLRNIFSTSCLNRGGKNEKKQRSRFGSEAWMRFSPILTVISGKIKKPRAGARSIST